MRNIYSSAALLIAACSVATAATLPVSDDFSNGNTNGWVSGNTGNVTFSGGAMNVGVNHLGQHAALQFDKVTLQEGYAFNASINFTTPATEDWATANAFRVALLNTSTVLPNNSNPNITGTGMMLSFNNLLGAEGTKSGSHLASRNTNSGPVTNSANPYTAINGGSNSAFTGGLGASTDYTYSITLINTGDGNIQITALLTGGNVTALAQTWTVAGTTIGYDFNTFAIGATAINPLAINSVDLSVAMIPESSTVSLLLGTLAVAAVAGYRRFRKQ